MAANYRLHHINPNLPLILISGYDLNPSKSSDTLSQLNEIN